MGPTGDDRTGVPRERLADLVGAAAYGTVLVLAALSVISVSDVALGHGAELVAGVGIATWLAHLFAELLARHVEHETPPVQREIARAAVDGSPIILATVLPAVALTTGRLDLVSDDGARLAAVVVATLQLFLVGVAVAAVAPVNTATRWGFAVSTAVVGLVIVVLTVALGH